MGDNSILHNWYGSVSATVITGDTVVNASAGKLYGIILQATTALAIATVYTGTTTGQTTSTQKLVISEATKGNTQIILLPVPIKFADGLVVQTTGARTTVLYD